jgi:hypothetical protein
MTRIAVLLLASAFAVFADANEDLLSASRTGDLAAVKAAVEHGAAVEAKTSYGQTPLYLAAMSGHEDIVRFLLDKGASTDITDTFYKAPMLAFVMQRKHWSVAKMLIAKTTKVDQTLGDVAGTGRAELVEAVLAAGKPSQGSLDKAYESALDRKQAEVAALLKKAGAAEPPPPVAVEAAVLESYAGNYRSDQMPIEVKVSTREGKLYIQPQGQPEMAMKTVTPKKFAITGAPVSIEFDAPDGFTLAQGTATFKFKKGAAK